MRTCGTIMVVAGNYYVGLYPAAEYDADQTMAPRVNAEHRGLHVVLDVTAISGDGIIPRVFGVGPTAIDSIGNPTSAVDYLLLAGPTITTTGITVLKIYPGIATVPNGAASDFLPWLWKVTIDHLGTTPSTATYSVFALLEG